MVPRAGIASFDRSTLISDESLILLVLSYVEAQRQHELTGDLSSRPVETASPGKVNRISTITLQFKLDDLAPSGTIRQAVDDWFEFVHPAAPVVHRATFLQQLELSSVSEDLDFLLLVVSVCSATVSTLRRRCVPYASFISVEKCYHVISTLTQARGPLPISLIRCQTKYNMACSLVQQRGMDNQTTQLLFTEVTTMVSHLLHYEVESASIIDHELIKRLYWLCFAGQW